MTVQEMHRIQHEELKEAMKGNPELDAEGGEISKGKRKSIDQPPIRRKIDPLR